MKRPIFFNRAAGSPFLEKGGQSLAQFAAFQFPLGDMLVLQFINQEKADKVTDRLKSMLFGVGFRSFNKLGAEGNSGVPRPSFFAVFGFWFRHIQVVTFPYSQKFAIVAIGLTALGNKCLAKIDSER